jgi:DNA-binding transcriptional MerR regulator
MDAASVSSEIASRACPVLPGKPQAMSAMVGFLVRMAYYGIIIDVYVNFPPTPMTAPTWTISELAHEFSITPRTIRFYEDQGIVSPTRDGRNRIYHSRDRTRLKLALRGKRLGLQLAEICSLIDMYDGPGDTEAQLRHYLEVLAQHRQVLEQQRQDLEQTLSEIDAQREHCEALLARWGKPGTTA